MADELIDIINDQDEVEFQMMKSEAHKKGLLHRCVIAEIVNSKGEYLLVKQASDRQDAGQYVSPVGGHVVAGETIDDALRREVREEVGITDINFTAIGKAVFDRKVIGRHENHLFIVYEIYSDQLPVLNEESESYRWFTKAEIVKGVRERRPDFGEALIFVYSKFYL